LEQTLEVVVYTLDGHMPVYYRSFPGNMPDSRSLETILLDLKHAGFPDVVLITDRGYESMRTLEDYITRGQAMVMCTKVGQKHVRKVIESFGGFSDRPDGMSIDTENRLYFSQHDIAYNVEHRGGKDKASDRLKLNLYFDATRRSDEIVQLDIDIRAQEALLKDIRDAGTVVEDTESLKKECRYFKINYKSDSAIIETYELDANKVRRAKKTSGFFAITTHKLDYNPMETYNVYKLRDEQETCFQQMKSQMVADRQRNWSEEGKIGRRFILFVSMIIGSYVRHIWESTELSEHFSSSLEVLDEMRSIRCVENTNRQKHITAFVGDQVRICNTFNFEIPEGCSPEYVSKQSFTHRRGRPRKKKATEEDF
jgi:transposase